MSEAWRALVRTTPLVSIPAVDARLGPVWLKLENLQRTGSFKLRGAARKLARLDATMNAAMDADARKRGVVAASAGNHGAGVAFAAARLGMAATVVVPRTAPAIKKERIASMGAGVIVRGEGYDQAEAEARELAASTGAVFVSPFDDDDIIEGNGGSLADEICAQAAELGEPGRVVGREPDRVVGRVIGRVICPVGGGGLIGGLAARLGPRGVSVIGVQPENNCAMVRSLEQGRAVTEYSGEPTLAEGCEGAVADSTYRLVRDHAEGIALVSEAAIRRAVAFCYRVAGTIVECSAAVAVAGLLEGVVAPAPRGLTVCILTGSNIEPDLLDDILAGEPA
jgi:threonine dehydratase